MFDGNLYQSSPDEPVSPNRNDLSDLNLQPFAYDQADYRVSIAIQNAVFPETRESVAAWRHADETRDPRYLFKRFVARQGEEAVALCAYGETPWSHQPGKYFVHVVVHPKWQRRGIGGYLYRFIIEELRERDPKKLVSWTKEDKRAAVRFLHKRGFKQNFREPISRLASASFDAEPFATKLDRVRQSGIAITTIRELSTTDPEWKRKLYELEWECLQDVPTPDPFTKTPYERFEKRTLGSPNLLPDAWFVALDGDQYVGLSVLWRNLADDRLLETGLTGVVRSHRRRGIATAMKVHAIRHAQAHGGAVIETDNNEHNPMFQLNLRLGFVPQPAYLGFEKLLASADAVNEDEGSK